MSVCKEKREPKPIPYTLNKNYSKLIMLLNRKPKTM